MFRTGGNTAPELHDPLSCPQRQIEMSDELAKLVEEPDRDARKRVRAVLTRYQRPSTGRALWQIFNTLVPYVLLWVLMYHVKEMSLWLAMPLACSRARGGARLHHLPRLRPRSFFRSRWANAIVGIIVGVLTFTPSDTGARTTSCTTAPPGTSTTRLGRRVDDDGRGVPARRRAGSGTHTGSTTPLRHVHGRSGVQVPVPSALCAVHGELARTHSVWSRTSRCCASRCSMGWLSASALPAAAHRRDSGGRRGIWLFYVQHHFEGAYWDRDKQWDYVAAAMRGSSYYKLPRVLQWVSGNIGFHHLHHLSPQIPTTTCSVATRRIRFSSR